MLGARGRLPRAPMIESTGEFFEVKQGLLFQPWRVAAGSLACQA